MIPDNIPEELKRTKAVFDKHIKEVKEYQRSYQAASDFIQRTMKRYNSAREFAETIPYTESAFLEQQLMTSKICPNPLMRKFFSETACRFMDYGCVSAKVYQYEPHYYYIILDTGTIDFFFQYRVPDMGIFRAGKRTTSIRSG
jgi:hypothetical protein